MTRNRPAGVKVTHDKAMNNRVRNVLYQFDHGRSPFACFEAVYELCAWRGADRGGRPGFCLVVGLDDGDEHDRLRPWLVAVLAGTDFDKGVARLVATPISPGLQRRLLTGEAAPLYSLASADDLLAIDIETAAAVAAIDLVFGRDLTEGLAAPLEMWPAMAPARFAMAELTEPAQVLLRHDAPLAVIARDRDGVPHLLHAITEPGIQGMDFIAAAIDDDQAKRIRAGAMPLRTPFEQGQTCLELVQAGDGGVWLQADVTAVSCPFLPPPGLTLVPAQVETARVTETAPGIPAHG